MGPIGFPETSIRNYHYLLRKDTEWHSSYTHHFVPNHLILCSRIDRPIFFFFSLGVFVCIPTPLYTKSCVPSLGSEYLYSLPLLTQFQIYIILLQNMKIINMF